MMDFYKSSDINIFTRLLKILVDGGYTGDSFAGEVKKNHRSCC